VAKRIYLETTIPSYLAARPARDLLQAARQRLTHDWWDGAREQYELCASQTVLDECAAGNAEAAARRISVLDGIDLLVMNEDVAELAAELIAAGLVPVSAARDALHVAISAHYAVDFLLTWNCRHIANAHIMNELRDFVSARGFALPEICTPEELLGA
jgi:hypothetical protein